MGTTATRREKNGTKLLQQKKILLRNQHSTNEYWNIYHQLQANGDNLKNEINFHVIFEII